MHRPLRILGHAAVAASLVMAAAAAGAADIIEHVVSYGAPTLPFSTSFGQTYLQPSAPLASDRFYDDYGFVVTDASFSSISATFNLGTILSVSGLEMRVIAGDPWSGPLPGFLSALDLAARAAGTIVSGTGSGTIETINPFALAPGHYFLEVSGVVDGTFGGSYGGVLNIVPVPEAPALPMALAGLAAIGFLTLRRRG